MSADPDRLRLPTEIAGHYSSRSQRARVITESWVRTWAFCPNCGHALHSFENNRPVADFYCKTCSEEYELKSKKGHVARSIVDGAYTSMMARLGAANNPNLLLLAYDTDTYSVNTLLAIPKHFFVPSIIERRRPLRPTARRAGWIGCNIVIENLPTIGKVFLLRDGSQPRGARSCGTGAELSSFGPREPSKRRGGSWMS